MSPADLLKERGIKVINLDYVTSAEAIAAAIDLAGVPGLRATLGDIPWSTRVTQSTMEFTDLDIFARVAEVWPQFANPDAPHREEAARRLCAVGWRPDMSVGEAWVLLEPRHADRRQPFRHDAGAQRHDDSEP